MAIRNGATHLWANTILFGSHPLQTSQKLTPQASEIFVVGQPPALVENCDDKAFLNGKLRELGGYTLPCFWLLSKSNNLDEFVHSIDRFPVVGKPVRGRGSHGVKLCHDPAQLKQHVETLLEESPLVMVEEYLTGEEATITVMPPSPERREYWSMPPVTRFNHADGIAPYSGVTAVTANSRAVTEKEMEDPAYGTIMEESKKVAQLIRATAPIRVDVRRFSESSNFALFDINMKPVRYLRSLGILVHSSTVVSNLSTSKTEHDWAQSSRPGRSSKPDGDSCCCNGLGLRNPPSEDPSGRSTPERLPRLSQSVLIAFGF